MLEHDLLLMTALIFAPAAFGLTCLFFPRRYPELVKWWALVGAAGTLTLGLVLLVDYYNLLDSYSDRGPRSLNHPSTLLDARADEAARRAVLPTPEPALGYDCYASRPWVERFGINYQIGLDGLSLPLVLLTGVVMLFAVLASWNVTENVRGYFCLLLVLETGVVGTFLALDLFLLYVFYEVMLIPMYFLIGRWGANRRKYAAMKFVLYTLVGSVLLLVAVIGLSMVDVRDFVDKPAVESAAAARKRDNPRLSADDAGAVHTFSVPVLQRAGQAAMLHLTGQGHRLAPRADGPAGAAPDAPADDKVRLLGRGADPTAAQGRMASQSFFTSTYQYVFFILLFVGFAVKVPIVPLHSWLPDAHVEAPTPVSMVLAGVLLKLGGYGILRLAYPVCPYAAEQLAWVVAGLGAFAIVYGALVAMGQTDFKRLLAYSSVSHMGYVILGAAVWAAGARSQYWAWGMNGATYQMLAHGITSAGMFFVVGVVYERAHHRDLNGLGGLMSSMPLYGGLSAVLFFATMGLPGLCGFVGEVFVVLGSWNFSPALSLAAILATVLTAAYLLWAWQRAFLGVNPATADYPDLTARETIILGSFVVLAIALGVLPQTLVLNWSEGSITGLVESLARLTPSG